MRLQTKLTLLLCALTSIILLLLSLAFREMLLDTYKKQEGSKALNLAQMVAAIPDVREAFAEPDPSLILQPMVEEIRRRTDAEFIVVGNAEGIRYAHPNAKLIGQPMVGGDNGPVFAGQSIVSEATGTLGPSLRGKTPVYGADGSIIGVVSVGILTEDIERKSRRFLLPIAALALAALALSALGAALIARHVKRAIHGLEPEDIGRLYREQEAVLESVREGIVAVNNRGEATLLNQQAMRMLGLEDRAQLLGRPARGILPDAAFPRPGESEAAAYGEEAIVGTRAVIVSRVPVKDAGGRVVGAVSSFRDQSELYLLTQQLSQMQQYADGLRAQTHEFSNKLHTISGLLQLDQYREAVAFIARESDSHSSRIGTILKEIPDPVIGGLLLGKINRAQELRVELEVGEDSTFRDVPPELDRSQLVTILGNLIDNALEAVSHDGEGRVAVLLTDLGPDLVLEVEDNGCGIPEEAAERIFEVGYSTKSKERRGYGLALVQRSVRQLGGWLEFQPGERGGTRFTVAIPKQRSDSP